MFSDSPLSPSLSRKGRGSSGWMMLSTAPMTGAENMDYDRETLKKLQEGDHPAVLRFFRWEHPVVSYGRHQRLESIRHLIPATWETVQRPTGGGMVLHDRDLCVSLCWRAGQAPLPARVKDVYRWIHTQMLQALPTVSHARLASCRDCSTPSDFAVRSCFSEPVIYDILSDQQKIVGGALCREKEVFLYQGSIQDFGDAALENRLIANFQKLLLAE